MPASAAGPSLGWQVDLGIEADLNGTASSPQVAMDNAGNAFAVWVQSNGTEAQVWANRFLVGSGWGAATIIESVAGNASDPQVAADELGNAIAVWTQQDGVRDNVWASPFWVGYGWRTAQLVESESGGFAQHPKVAMDRDGDAVVVWEQFDGAQNTIQANRLPLHQSWETATIVAANGLQRVFNPEVAVNASGDAIAVWTQSDGANPSVWANRFLPGAGWGAAVALHTNATGSAYAPQVAVDGTGNATAVWYEHNGSVNDIWAARFERGPAWGNATLVEAGDGNAIFPQVAVDKSGAAVVIWVQDDGLAYYIGWNSFDPGSGWGNGTLLDTFPQLPAEAQPPDLGMGRNGDAVAVWTHDNGVGYDVMAAKNVYGSGWGNATVIETDAGDAHTPSLGVDPSGIAVAVWAQQNGTNQSIRANRFEAPDTTPPVIHLYQPLDGSHLHDWGFYVFGATEPSARVAIDGAWDVWNPRPDGTFGDVFFGITPGTPRWSTSVTAMDAAGNQATVSVGGDVYGDTGGTLLNEIGGLQALLAAALDNATALQASLNNTRAELAAAQANVTAAEATIADLEAAGNATQAQLAAARGNLSTAQGQVAQWQANATALNASLQIALNAASVLQNNLLGAQAERDASMAAENISSAQAAAAAAARDATAGQLGVAMAFAAAGIGFGVFGLVSAAQARRRLVTEQGRKRSGGARREKGR